MRQQKYVAARNTFHRTERGIRKRGITSNIIFYFHPLTLQFQRLQRCFEYWNAIKWQQFAANNKTSEFNILSLVGRVLYPHHNWFAAKWATYSPLWDCIMSSPRKVAAASVILPFYRRELFGTVPRHICIKNGNKM